MRSMVIAGNWKMYKTNREAIQLVKAVKTKIRSIKKTKVIVCPPATALSEVAKVIADSKIGLGAQNLYWEKEGAYTGEISADMIKSTRASFVIIGHSERRQYFGETDGTVNNKLKTALKENLKPILCIGETLDQRENGVTKEIVGNQIECALKGIPASYIKKIILAYEPVWAIGTGKTATPEQAQEVHEFIRSLISDIYGSKISKSIIIQYGGSVKPANAYDLLKQPDIDGALVGGACLEAASFIEIIKAAEKVSSKKY
jgi:triosephosphate isomerase